MAQIKFNRLFSLVAVLLVAGLILTGLPGCGEPAPAPAPTPAPAPKPAPPPAPAPKPAPAPAPEPKPAPKPAPAPRTLYDLKVVVEPAGGGSVEPGSGTYPSGESVTLEAKPAEGYKFDRWGGDIEGNSPSISVMMNVNKNVMAYFKEAIEHQTITYEMPPGSGSAYALSYFKQLEAGQVVEGVVELTGEQQSGDQFASWKFQVIGAVNNIVQEWEGNISSNQSHKFSFTATMAGRYIIKISHISRYTKNLRIEVKPPGWAIMGTQ